MTLPRLGERTNAEPIASPTGLQPPVADFSVVVVGNQATFTSLSTDPDGEIVSYAWNFGDAATTPTAKFTYTISGLVVTFVDQSFDVAPGSVVGWTWNFGDGVISTARNPSHTYAAGGSYNVSLTVTDNEGNSSPVADQQVISVAPGGLGIYYGVWEGMTTTAYKNGMESFNATVTADDKNTIPPRLITARNAGRSCFLHPWASHVWATKNGQYDQDTWDARLASIDTPAVRTAVEDGRQDGSAAAMMVIEEPQHPDYGGIITRQIIDANVRKVKQVFGSLLPVGCNVTSFYHASDGPYTDLDFTQSQFVWAPSAPYSGNPAAWRDGRLADSALSGTKWVAGLNISNGGAGYAETVCPIPPTGGNGLTFPDRCAMGTSITGTYPNGQLRDGALAIIAPDSLGRSAAGLLFWRHVPEYFSRDQVLADFATIGAATAARPAQSLLRGQP